MNHTWGTDPREGQRCAVCGQKRVWVTQAWQGDRFAQNRTQEGMFVIPGGVTWATFNCVDPMPEAPDPADERLKRAWREPEQP